MGAQSWIENQKAGKMEGCRCPRSEPAVEPGHSRDGPPGKGWLISVLAAGLKATAVMVVTHPGN